MVIVNLKDGLGNQIFQYCFSLFLNTKCKFNIDSFKFNFKRQLEVINFPKVEIDFLKNSDLSNASETIQIIDDFSFSPAPILDETKTYIFDGYWQNKNYLAPNEAFIKSVFTATDEDKNKIFDRLPVLAGEECISLHVRRSDYINLNNYYCTLGLEYYDKALDLLPKNLPIFVFSDDILWCKANLKYKNLHFITNSPKLDLQIMSLCTHNIIANSTFSFWGAYLNSNINKKVIAPKQWLKKEYALNISKNRLEDISPNINLDDWAQI
jgi:hypothetical protein